MTVVIGFGFPEEVILISDSRISFGKERKPKDELRKVYQLGPYLAVGFTSEHVEFTMELLRRITLYAKSKTRSKATLHLLDKIPKAAIHEYKTMAKTLRIKPPLMEFIYVGLITDRYLPLPSETIMELLKSTGGGNLPKQIAIAFQNERDGLLNIPPPTPVVAKQIFPSGKLEGKMGYGFMISGSGSVITPEIKKAYGTMFHTPSESLLRTLMTRYISEEIIKKSGVGTVGGVIQMIQIGDKGARAPGLALKRTDEKGQEREIMSVKFDGREWIKENKETGEVERVKQNPFFIDTSKKFKVGKSSWSG